MEKLKIIDCYNLYCNFIGFYFILLHLILFYWITIYCIKCLVVLVLMF